MTLKKPGARWLQFQVHKSSWEVIKSDIYAIVEEFWKSSGLPRGSNSAFIAHSKNQQSFGIQGFQTNQYGRVCVQNYGKAFGSTSTKSYGPSHQFIKGRQVLDGALIASELVDSYMKSKEKSVILKYDFHKAFDNISWSFLDWFLGQMTFPSRWHQ